jgi:Fe-S-cluster-containing dehydrogenase component
MTELPPPSAKKLGLVIDLDTCVGCQACATNCKEWNTGGHLGPLPDLNAYSAGAEGVTLNAANDILRVRRGAGAALRKSAAAGDAVVP